MSKKTLNAETQSLSDKIVSAGTVGDGGIITGEGFIDGKFTEAHRPEILTNEIMSVYENFRSTLVAATAHATGELGLKAFEENKDLESVSSEFAFGKDTIRHQVYRNSVVGNKNINGHVVTALDVYATGPNRGQLGIAHRIIRDKAADMFGDKE